MQAYTSGIPVEDGDIYTWVYISSLPVLAGILYQIVGIYHILLLSLGLIKTKQNNFPCANKSRTSPPILYRLPLVLSVTTS